MLTWHHGLEHWLAFHTGSLNTPGTPPNYNFWSGFGSDFGEYVIIAALLAHFQTFWVTHTCRARWWCWRPGTHKVEGFDYRYCHVHHPDDIPSARQVADGMMSS